MIARKIVIFCVFILLKQDKLFDKNLEHDTYGVE